jgi:hypothetical protein
VAGLKLEVKTVQNGPFGSNKLTPTTFIQRVSTSGGLAPSTGCDSMQDVGRPGFVPYTAEYFFSPTAKAGTTTTRNPCAIAYRTAQQPSGTS